MASSWHVWHVSGSFTKVAPAKAGFTAAQSIGCLAVFAPATPHPSARASRPVAPTRAGQQRRGRGGVGGRRPPRRRGQARSVGRAGPRQTEDFVNSRSGFGAASWEREDE